MRRDGGSQGYAAPSSALFPHLLGGCLRTEEGSRRIDIEGLPPLRICHLEGVETPNDSRKAEQVVQ